MRLLVRVAASVLVTLALLPAAATAQGSVTVVRVRPTAGEGLGKTLTVRLAVVDQFFEPDSQPPVPHLRGRVEADDPATDEFKGTEEADADECGSPLWPKRYRFRGDEIELLGVSREAVTSGSEGARNAIGTLEYLISPAYESGFYDPLSFRGLTWVDFAQRYGLGLLPGPEQLLEGLLTWEMDSLTTVVDVVSSGFDPVNWRPVRELPSSYSWFASDVQTYQGTLDDGTAVTLRFQYAWALPRFAGGRARFAIRNLNSHLPSSYYYDLTVNLNSWLTFREREFAKGTVWGEYQVFDLPPGVLGPGEPLPRIVTADVRVKQWTLRWDFNLFTCDPVLGRIDNLQGVTIDPPGVEGTAEPLQIAGEPRVHYRDASSVTVTWTTTHPSSSRVRVQDYPTGASPRRVERAEFVTEHTLDVTGLDGTAPYTLFVESVSAAGAQVVHRVDRVVARELIDRAPPVISALQEVHTWPYSSAWRWRTDEPARCAVRYRPRQSGEPFSELVNEAFQTVHENLPITGLTPLTGYDLIVRCEDRPGNAAEASEYFETPRQRSGSTVLWGGNVPGSPAPPLNTTISVNDPGEITIEGGVSGAIDPCGVVTCASFSLSVQRLDTGATVLSATASSQSGPVPLGTLKIDPHDVDTIGGLRLIVSGGNVNSVAVVTVRETFLDYRRIADEPSDSPGTATAIPVNADYAAYLWEDANASLTDYSGDADYLQVTLPSPGTATVKVTSPVEFVIAPSTYICEYIRVDVTRADTGALVRGEDVGNCDQTRVTETVATVLVDAADTRTFVIRLAHQYNNSGTPVGSRLAIPATYTVRVEFTPLPLERIADEPNDSPEAPTVIPVNTDYRAYLWEDGNASLTDYSGDADYLQVTLPGPGTATVKVTSPVEFVIAPSTYICEYIRVDVTRADTGALVRGEDVGNCDQTRVTETVATVLVDAADTRTFVIRLAHQYNNSGTPVGSRLAIPATYTVRVEFTPLPLERIADEPNDSPAAPTVIPVNTDYRAYLWEDANASLTDYNGDVDYVQFTVPGPGTAVVKVTSPFPFPASSWSEVMRVATVRTDTGAGVASVDVGANQEGGLTKTLTTLQLGPADWRTYRLSLRHVQLRHDYEFPGGAAFPEPYAVLVEYTPLPLERIADEPNDSPAAPTVIPVNTDYRAYLWEDANASLTDYNGDVDYVQFTVPGPGTAVIKVTSPAPFPVSSWCEVVRVGMSRTDTGAGVASFDAGRCGRGGVTATLATLQLGPTDWRTYRLSVQHVQLRQESVWPGGAAFREPYTVRIDFTPSGGTSPTCAATATPQVGLPPLRVDFSSTVQSADPSTTVRWDFGDGTSSTDRVPTHLYTTPGVYQVAFHAVDSAGTPCSVLLPVNVKEILADAAVSATTGEVPLRIRANAVVQSAVGAPSLYRWDFGDGQSAFGELVEHTYRAAGTFQLQLTVQATTGATAVATTTITVTNSAAFREATGKRFIHPPFSLDVNADGRDETIVTDTAGAIHAYGTNGKDVAGYPIATGARVLAAPLVAAMDGTTAVLVVLTAEPKIRFYGMNGVAATPASVTLPAQPATPLTLADLDGDGLLEAIWADAAGTLHAVNVGGTAAPGFPATLDAAPAGAIAVGELGGDGPHLAFVSADGRLLVLDRRARALGRPVVLGRDAHPLLPPLLSDLDGDGTSEILVASTDGTVHAIDQSFRGLRGFPRRLSAPLSSSPITADLDNDGAREIYALTSDNRLHAWTMTATSVVDVTGFPRVLEATVGQGLRALEVGGDGQGELVFIDDEGTLHVVSATGEARSGYPMALGEAAFLPSFVGTGTGVGYWSVVSTDGYHTARPGAHAVSLVPEGWSRERYDHGGTNAPVPAPADLVASQDPAATSVTVSWKAAHPVMPLDYLVTIVDPVSGTTLDERLVHAGFATFASLSPGSTYDVSVRRLLRAVPRVVGPASGPLRVTVGAPAPPGTPPAPVLTQRGSGRVEVAWTSASPSVRVYYTLGDAAAGPTHAMVATASPVAIDRLVPGETLTVWMTALTGSGTFTESAMSAPAGLSIAALSATPPTDLVADSTGIAGEVLLSWADANTATETYRVHFGRTAGGPYTGSDPAIGDSPLSVRGRAVRLQGLEPGAAYYFVVSAVDGQGGEGSVSDEAMAVPLAESEVVAPILLSALERDQGVELRWQGVSYRNDHRYRVHHGPVEAPASSVVDVGAALTAVIDGVPAGQVRVFQVSAADGRGVESGLSNAITVHRGAPATPAGFVATNAGRGGTVALHWSANTEPDLDGYMLTYGRAGAPSFEVQLPPTAVSRLVTGLEDGRAHEFSLAAFDASGLRGAATSPATATPDASALVIDPFEPDDVPAASRALAVGASEVHTINPVGDEDWFSVAVVSGATYLFTVAAPGDDLSPSLQVWDAEAKTLLRRTHDSSRTGCALGWTADRTGQVLARVRDVEGDAWGQRTGYTFSVQEATGVAGPILFGPIVARELPGADGDGALEPGEPFALDVVLTNGGTLPRTNLLLRVTPRSACVETSSASSMVSGLAGEAVTTRSLAFRVATACPGGTPLRFAIDVEDDLAQRWSLGFEISTSNRPPESNIVSPSENVRVQVGASVSFAGAATDEDSGVGGVRWDFGGVRPDSDSLSPGAVVFAQPGTYPVTFTAFDVWGVPDPSPAQVVVEARSAVPVFTDDPLVARVTPIRAVHVTELRQRIDELRARYGLVAFVWTDASLSPVQTLIRAIHLTELRASLTELYVAAGRPAPTFTPPAVTPGLTAVTAAQIQELRAAVLGIW